MGDQLNGGSVDLGDQLTRGEFGGDHHTIMLGAGPGNFGWGEGTS